ncbi:MAG: hypothetical protein Q8Q23_03700 [bacterium]|nr:hypothetical protein [bacterium]
MINFFKKIVNIKNMWLFLSIGLIIVLVLFYFSILPNFSKLNDISNEVRIMNSEMQKKAEKITLEDFLVILNQYEEKQKVFNDTVLSNNRRLELITALEDNASLYNVEQKINFRDITAIEGTNYYVSELQIWISGDFNNSLRYLDNLEKLPFYINIDDIKISSKQDENNSNFIDVVISSKIYWQ